MIELNYMIESFLNGNLTDAKRMAKEFEAWEIREALVEQWGYSERKAGLTADWLKGRDCWQQACDAK